MASPSYEDPLPMHDPVVVFHNSGLASKHDVACAVCRDRKAVFRIDLDVFVPCAPCGAMGWTLESPDRWVHRWVRRLIGGSR